MTDWSSMLAAMMLVVVRIGGLLVFAPFFSSRGFPARVKAMFVVCVAFDISPLVVSLPRAYAHISFASILGELFAGFVFGTTLSLFQELLLFTGAIAGVQLSFSLVNLMDPNSNIQSPLISEMLSWFGLLVLIASGLDRVILGALLESFRAAPVGSFASGAKPGLEIVTSMSGVFLASLELAAPLLASTLLVEFVIALLGKLSPQLPVMWITVPVKTIVGMGTMAGSIALWPRFLGLRLEGLLHLASSSMLRLAEVH